MGSLKDIKIFLKESEKELYAEPVKVDIARDLKVQYSADNRIDSFLIKFESDSVISDEDIVQESLKNLDLRVLFEQGEAPADLAAGAEDEDEDEEAEEEAGDEGGEDSPEGAERSDADVGLEIPKLPIDIDKFASKVAKLILNSDVLLDLKTVIVNRSLKFLTDNYDEEHAKRLLESLDNQFDIEIDDPGKPVEDSYAVGAYAGGTGGLGGGA